ncbi:MAG: MFS transporter, partial [Rhodobacterales bacterium]|nr:MFS transporter [Rhodobacterales bacterium]
GSLLLGWVADIFGLFFAGSSLIFCSLICLLYISLKSQSFRK